MKLAAKLRGLLFGLRFKKGRNLTVRANVAIDNPNVVLGDNVSICSNVHIFGLGEVVIGDNVVLGDGSIICSAKSVRIGDDTMVAAHCCLFDCNHGMKLGTPMREQPMSVRPVRVGADCWLGAGVIVLAGSNISDGTVVAAGTVVGGDLPGCVIASHDRGLSLASRRRSAK